LKPNPTQYREIVAQAGYRIVYLLRKLHPGTLILLSFLATVALGGLVLMLPVATVEGRIDATDAFFTATSAVCVTGLTVADTGGTFTRFGQIVILILIQLGGLGIMTVSVTIFRFLGKAVTYRQRTAMQDVFAATPRKDIYQVLRSVFGFTILAEAAGAILLFIHFLGMNHPWDEALFSGLFHSVSAFCNAGFGLYKANMMDFQTSILLNLTICGLIVSGGIGFPVVHDIHLYFSTRRKKKANARLSVQTRVVLITTAILIFGGMVILYSVERTEAFSGKGLQHTLLTTLFQSVTCRTAGFNTVDIGALSNVTLLFMIFFMFIGASPGSTGGGVKTTTFALLCMLAWTRLRRRQWVNMFKRTVPTETVHKSVTLVFISLALVFIVFFLMLATAPDTAAGAEHSVFLAYIFETVSAFGTVGLSMGITPTLSIAGKWMIIFTMLVGRVGVLTFAYVFTGAEPRGGLERAEENIMIG